MPAHALHVATLKLFDGLIETLTQRRDDKTVHAARKAAKRIRAALRLMRDCLGPAAYHRENLLVRDAAKPLTGVRDVFMLRRMLRSVPRRPVRFERVLESEYQRERRAFARHGLQTALARLQTSRKNLSEMSPVAPEIASAVEGVSNTYRAGRKAMVKAKCNDDLALHEWRKQAKYLFNQLELLHAVFGLNARTLRRRAEKVADILGDDHDWSVLGEKLRHCDADTPRLTEYIDKRRRHLQRRAVRHGRKLYCHSAKRFQAGIAQSISAPMALRRERPRDPLPASHRRERGLH